MIWEVTGWLFIVYQVDRMIVNAGVLSSTNQKERYWYNLNSWRGLWRRYFWPSRPSHKDFFKSPGGRRKFFALKSFTRLVVCSGVSSLGELFTNRMSALPKVKKGMLMLAKKKSFRRIKPFPAYSGAKNLLWQSWPSWLFKPLWLLLPPWLSKLTWLLWPPWPSKLIWLFFDFFELKPGQI